MKNNIDINEIINTAFELAKKHKELTNELLNDENISQEVKDELIKLEEEFEQKKLENEKYIEDNKHKKIIRYNPETFMPVFED